jgi:enoyl-CoA hydratase
MTVYVEKDGPVTIIILSRPEVRNAVGREAAKELTDAFRSFSHGDFDKRYSGLIETSGVV